MPEIVTIGETMAAFTPDHSGFLRYAREYEMRIAGAESNLAIGVCKLGHTAGWISRLGNDEFGQFVQNSIRAEGVDTSKVVSDPAYRTGIMFKQVLQSSETSVFYYRENSAASHMDKFMLDEEYIRSCKVLHLTGITPVLSDSCEEITISAFDMAERLGIPVSFDPNIRKKLWEDLDYAGLLYDMMMRAQIVMLGLDEANVLLGTTDVDEILDALFVGGTARYVAIKDGANGAVVATPYETCIIPPYPCKCVDPIGAGDAFNAAFLCGILEGRTIKECGIMGGAAGALATETYGDTEGYPSIERIEAAIHGTAQIYR